VINIVVANNMHPKHQVFVSVVMPSYNHGAYIKEAIESVLRQTYSNLELIVVDNYSTDNTDQVVASFNDPRLKYLKFNNQGIIAAGRNFGVKHAQGQILAFIDADDIWLLEKLAIQLPHILQEDIACLGTTFIPIGYIKYCKLHCLSSKTITFKDYHYQEIALANPLMTSSVLVKTSDFSAVGGFDENVDFKFIEDWELWLRLCVEKNARVLAQPLLKYRVFANKDRDSRDIALRTLNIINKHFQSGYLNKEVLKKMQGNCYATISKSCLDVNDYKGAKYALLAIMNAQGLVNKSRAMAFLGIFLAPKKLRRLLMNMASLLRNKFF
jgi:glycosyltransferase involved in cell wall biosynthesis